MSDYPGHPNDGNYDCLRYQRAVVWYFWTMLVLMIGFLRFISWYHHG